MKLESIKTIANIIGILAIPIVSLIIGNNYTQAIKEREIQGKFVELAVNILNNVPTEDNKNIRNWSIDVINEYSGVKINKETRTELINKIQISSNVDLTIQVIYEKALEYYNKKEYLMSQTLSSQLRYDFRPSAKMLANILLLEGKSYKELGKYIEATESLSRLSKSQSADSRLRLEADKILRELNKSSINTHLK
jgi:hypothetical protein